MNNALNQKIPSNSPIRIDHYRIIKKLGQGGMSIVYEGFDERLKRPVALKVLHPLLAESSEYRARFFREALAVARLTHPNIVQIFDVSSSEHDHENLYIATELIVGQTLRDYVKNVAIIEVPELSAMIIWQLCGALEHAHQKGIIHRDIKPENIMVCKDGRILLMDFGIASIGSDESLTQSGMLMGSLAHIAPEVIEGHRASVASDLFSLSTVFFWLLTGDLPFQGTSPHALLKAIVDSEAKKVQTLSPYISDDLATVLEKGMQKDVKNRFKTALEMAVVLEKALLNMGVKINTRLMADALRDNGEKLELFKSSVAEQIHQHIEYLKSHNQDAQAFALMCRINASLTDAPTKEFRKKSTRKKMLWSMFGAVLVGLIALATGTILSTNNKKIVHQGTPIVFKHEMPEAVKEEDVLVLKTEQPIKKTSHVTDEEELREIKVVIWPFANVIVDGKMIAKNQKSLTLKLKKGIHRLLFTHDYAATVEKVVTVDDVSKPLDLFIQLIKSKPAFLVIKSNINADVAVDGHYKGTTNKSIKQPIVIPMPDKTHAITKEIIVSEEGFQPFIVKRELIAGQVQEIEVTLTAKSAAQYGLKHQ